MLTEDQRAGFDRYGILKLPAAFSADAAAWMRAVVWAELARRYGIEETDPSTWDRHPPTGLRTAKKHRAFAPTLGPSVTAALDDLFGPNAWVRPKHYGQVLVTMPNTASWRVPHRLWHTDFGYDAAGMPAVKCWALFDDVLPGGGGTPQLAGSHRLMARYLHAIQPGTREYKAVRDGFLRSHPWLRKLSQPDDDPHRNRYFMDADADVDGLPARVIELTGGPGDVYVTHPWVFHSLGANAQDRPRLMRGLAIRATPVG